MTERDTSALKSRKEPRQQRSRELVDAVLEAAARIVGTAGVEALTTAELCALAGVSPGSLYQYFPSKEAVLYALLRRHAEAVTAGMSEVLATHHAAPAAVLVRAAVQTFVALHQQDTTVQAALGTWLARSAGPGLEDDLLTGAQQVLARILAARELELGGRDPAVTAFLLMRTLEGLVHAAARDAPALLDDPGFVAGIEEMLLAAVGVSAR